jgi:hypothetical protein
MKELKLIQEQVELIRRLKIDYIPPKSNSQKTSSKTQISSLNFKNKLPQCSENGNWPNILSQWSNGPQKRGTKKKDA